MDCLLEKTPVCGNANQTQECDLMKKSLMKELVKGQTEKAQVKVKESITICN